MGLTEIQKEMIRGIATNNMLKARQGALGALNEDTTQKNKNFVARYKSILTSEHGFLYELPTELKGLLQCEDVSMSFKESRYYVSEQQMELASKIFRMAEVSQKLMELQIPYKNATLLYGPPGTGKTMFARYIAFKKALPFCYLNFSRIIDSYMGSTAKNIAKAFAYASSNLEKAIKNGNLDLFVCPFPVKYVLEKGYRIYENHVVCDAKYREDMGLMVDGDYDEF